MIVRHQKCKIALIDRFEHLMGRKLCYAVEVQSSAGCDTLLVFNCNEIKAFEAHAHSFVPPALDGPGGVRQKTWLIQSDNRLIVDPEVSGIIKKTAQITEQRLCPRQPNGAAAG